MKTVFSIFTNDIRSISKHLFVIIIVVAMGTLPSLYAWINIYANWDPYGNTDGIPVAVATRDQGIDGPGGKYINSSREVMDRIEKRDDHGWTIIGSAREAEEGVESGKYYAAVIFEDGFTRDMHDFNRAISNEDPPITYYINEKMNAPAPKIIGLAMDDLLADINGEYLQVVFRDFYKDAARVPDIFKGDDAAQTAMEQLIQSRDALGDFNDSIDILISTSGNIKEDLSGAESSLKKKRKANSTRIAEARAAYKQAKKSADDVKKALDEKAKELKTALTELDEAFQAMHNAGDDTQREKLAEDVADRADEILTILQNLRSLIPDDPKTTGAKVTASVLDTMIARADNISRIAHTIPLARDMDEAISDDLDELNKLFSEALKPAFKRMVDDIKNAVEEIKPLLTTAKTVIDDIDPVIVSAGDTTDSLEVSLVQLKKVLTPLEEKLDDLIQQIQDAEGNDKTELLLEILGGDPDRYGRFFADLVDVKVEKIYTVQCYGEAMTPFYTMIALWVGAVMLVTLLRTGVDRREFPQAGETQTFFGRFLLFFLIGQVQAAVVVAGNIFLLGCRPEHPWLMWLTAAVTSMVFVMLIYALTVAFGDVGRAAAVVIMMIQIAGSSGTFPIEILPPVFDKIYRFFPFPYAINAMRETISGMYEHDYFIFMGKLLIFFVVAVIIGVFVRKPFAGVKQYMNDKMRETEVF